MRNLVLFMHVSLDGFVGGPNGEMDWIKVNDEMFEYASRATALADTAVYGRVTYEMMEAYWPTAADQPQATKHDREHSAWYNQVSKIVISRSMKGKTLNNTRFIDENIPEEISKLKQQPGTNLIMFGSPSAAHILMEHDLIDDYWLFINPILLGAGIPLFDRIKDRRELKLAEHKIFPSGVTAHHYKKLNA